MGQLLKHIVQYSGGVGSWCAAKRVVEQFGAADTVLLFADTKMEDPDLYRFLEEGATYLQAPLVRIADGRDVWQVFFDKRFLGNSRVDPCSRLLKRELMDRWKRLHYRPSQPPLDTYGDDLAGRLAYELVRVEWEMDEREQAILYFGIDWTEEHRITRFRPRAAPWVCEAPMCNPPYLSKKQMNEECAAAGIAPVRMYAEGFPHANCAGFCIKAGQAQFRLLLKVRPELYRYHERKEAELRAYLGKNVTILRQMRAGQYHNVTLEEFRHQVETDSCLIDKDAWGGCGCAID